MRRARFLSLLICQLGAASFSAAAQVDATAEIGWSRLRQAKIPEGNALSGGATIDFLGERSQFRATALATRQTESRWTGQAALYGSLASASPRSWWQLDAVATDFAQTSTLPTTSLEAAARLRTGSGLSGAALGLGGGMSAMGGRTGGVQRITGDGWWSAGNERFLTSFAWTHTTPPRALVAAYTSYADLSAGWRHEASAVSLGVSGGVRVRTSDSQSTDSWEMVDAGVWIAPRAALVVTAGRTLEDLVRGTPRTTWLGVSLRWSMSRHASLTSAAAERSAPRLAVTRVDPTHVAIDVTAPSATRVELMADFTDWQPVSLDRAGLTWRIERPITPGLHRVSIRLDGGEWMAPGNLPRASAGPEASIGLLTVP